MNTFAAILATLQLLAHALAGCCWHHGHVSAGSSTATHSVAANACCSHSQSRHADPSSHEGEQNEGAPDSCSEPRCVFIPVGETSSTHLLDLAPLFVFPATDTGSARSEERALVDSLFEHDVGPPVRLHALKQVLLI